MAQIADDELHRTKSFSKVKSKLLREGEEIFNGTPLKCIADKLRHSMIRSSKLRELLLSTSSLIGINYDLSTLEFGTDAPH